MQSEFPGNISDEAWNAVLALSDTDKNGKLSFDEYVTFVNEQQAAQHRGNPTEQMEQGLQALDLNNNGNLDKVNDASKIIMRKMLF